MLQLRNSSRSVPFSGADNALMTSDREFRFSKGGYSLYTQAGAKHGACGVVYSVYDSGEQLMDELPSLGEACALIERLLKIPAATATQDDTLV
jgi:hypothetical protein